VKEVLKQLGIRVDVVEECHTENISRYSLKLLPGATLEKLEKKATEIALVLKSYSRPIIYPVLHQGIVVLEVITAPLGLVRFDEFDLTKYANYKIPAVIGKMLNGEDLVFDLTEAPNLIVGGTTGAGKSVLLNSMICSILESGKDIRMALIDPKQVDMSSYKNVKQLLYPIATTNAEAQDIIDDLICVMNERFSKMAQEDVVNASDLHKKIPYVALFIDEMSDLVLSSKKIFSDRLCLLGQKCRAAGISLVLSTQRPAVSVMNGAIKAICPARISFKTASSMDSRVILDRIGACKLLGYGDGLIISEKHDMVRFKGAYISKEDIEAIALKHNISTKTKLLRAIRSWI
jgi:S-DNA-T family DNA segregation ATPase FtsK/SpoIIIE